MPPRCLRGKSSRQRKNDLSITFLVNYRIWRTMVATRQNTDYEDGRYKKEAKEELVSCFKRFHFLAQALE